MENRAEREIVRWRHEYADGTYEEGGYDKDGNLYREWTVK